MSLSTTIYVLLIVLVIVVALSLLGILYEDHELDHSGGLGVA